MKSVSWAMAQSMFVVAIAAALTGCNFTTAAAEPGQPEVNINVVMKKWS